MPPRGTGQQRQRPPVNTSKITINANDYPNSTTPNHDENSPQPLTATHHTYNSTLSQIEIAVKIYKKMIGVGAIVGVCLVALDAALSVSKRWSLPPLAVGIGIYLPMSATFAVVLGAVVGHW